MKKIQMKSITLIIIFILILLVPTTLSEDPKIKVFHVGDSHTAGSYGENLHTFIKDAGYDMYTLACGGASGITFGKPDYKPCKYNPIFIDNNNQRASIDATPAGDQTSNPYAEKLSEIQPNIIIISLGSNYGIPARVKGNEKQYIQAMINAIPESTSLCFWVGAPVTEHPAINAVEINQAFQEVLPTIRNKNGLTCTFIDAIPLTESRKLDTDKLHLTQEGGKDWAQNVKNIIFSTSFQDRLNLIVASTQNANKNQDSKQSPTTQQNQKPSTSSPQSPPPIPPVPIESASLQTCQSKESCKQIDEVWYQKLGFLVRDSRLVWNQKEKKYQDWQIIHPQPPVPSATLKPQAEARFEAPRNEPRFEPIPTSEFDEKLIAAAQKHNVRVDILKAISWAESGLQNDRISDSGAIGYFQFISKTEYFPKITKCCQMGEEGQYKEEEQRKNQGCIAENKITKTQWTREFFNQGIYFCSPENDDRFNPDLQVESGARLLASNFKQLDSLAFKSEEDKYKVAIASHNLGGRWIGDAIKSGNIQQLGPLTWEIVRNTVLKPMGCERGVPKNEIMDAYVTKIFNCAQTYNQEGMGARCTNQRYEFTRC